MIPKVNDNGSGKKVTVLPGPFTSLSARIPPDSESGPVSK